MKNNIQIAILVLAVNLFSCSNETASEKQTDHEHHAEKTYTCPMHPEIIRNEPGQCPICGMTLVEKKDKNEITGDTNDISFLLRPVNEFVIAHVNTISPAPMEFPLTINANGRINYDTREIYSVSARVSGWIEKLYVKYRFQPVYKGQKIFDIYSKELLTEQENLLFLLQNDSTNKSLILAAEKRLLLQGITSAQIEEIRKTGKTIYLSSVYSPVSGHLHETVSSENNDNSGMMNMPQPQTILHTKEGSHVEKGQTVFSVYGTDRVWAVINIPNEYFEKIEKGMEVIILTDNKIKINGKINFVEPVLNAMQKTVSARIYLPNSDKKLRIGMNINATIDAGKIRGLFIPSASVVHSGQNNVVFVKENGIFRSKIINTGITANGYVKVNDGISEKDKIAENGQMLVDSESFIKIEYGK